MPPDTITPVTPSAMRPMIDICRMTLTMLVVVRNAGERNDATIIISPKMRKIPYCEITALTLSRVAWRATREKGVALGEDAGVVGGAVEVTAAFPSRVGGCQVEAGGHLEDPLLGRVPAHQLPHLVALVHHHDAVAHAEDLGQLGRDHDDGLAAPRQVDHQPVDLGFRAHVDAARRLVEDQDLRLGQQPAGEQDLLLVPTREVPHLLLEAGGLDAERLAPMSPASPKISPRRTWKVTSRNRLPE